MMSVEKRLELLERLGKYMLSDEAPWMETKDNASRQNAWFTKEHIDIAVENIGQAYLRKEHLQEWIAAYKFPSQPKKVGIVMAGNIPLVGFHDFLCGFVSGHELHLKLSSKDERLLGHLIRKMIEWEPQVATQVHIAENLKHCEAYIATGSNNTARYFEQYFGKYPNIIRKNRTSVALLEGDETEDELTELAKDVFTYYGLGCRNVTQLCVPHGYDFSKLLEVLKVYDEYILHHKYKNNYDYHFAIYLLNKVPFLTNELVMLVENELPFSAVSVLHYRYYTDVKTLARELETRNDIQTIVGRGFTPFGAAQKPSLNDYADGVDTMDFLCSLK
ncbi:MAG TPA: acyl-CoA reductase [Flavipsychrobacter sp.]|nr:acyl-CoA reductase [Flavipsychrobacter sp.]